MIPRPAHHAPYFSEIRLLVRGRTRAVARVAGVQLPGADPYVLAAVDAGEWIAVHLCPPLVEEAAFSFLMMALHRPAVSSVQTSACVWSNRHRKAACRFVRTSAAPSRGAFGGLPSIHSLPALQRRHLATVPAFAICSAKKPSQPAANAAVDGIERPATAGANHLVLFALSVRSPSRLRARLSTSASTASAGCPSN